MSANTLPTEQSCAHFADHVGCLLDQRRWAEGCMPQRCAGCPDRAMSEDKPYEAAARAWMERGYNAPYDRIYDDEDVVSAFIAGIQHRVAVPRDVVAVPAALLERIAPDAPISQDEQGGCVWCGGDAVLDPAAHDPDCPWVAARRVLAAANRDGAA